MPELSSSMEGDDSATGDSHGTQNPFGTCKGSKRLISDSVDAHLGAAFLNLGFSSPAWRKKVKLLECGQYDCSVLIPIG